jgi:hypothetical protein
MKVEESTFIYIHFIFLHRLLIQLPNLTWEKWILQLDNGGLLI